MSRPTYTRTGEPESPTENEPVYDRAPVEDQECADCPQMGEMIYQDAWVCCECAQNRAGDRKGEALREREP